MIQVVVVVAAASILFFSSDSNSIPAHLLATKHCLLQTSYRKGPNIEQEVVVLWWEEFVVSRSKVGARKAMMRDHIFNL